MSFFVIWFYDVLEWLYIGLLKTGLPMELEDDACLMARKVFRNGSFCLQWTLCLDFYHGAVAQMLPFKPVATTASFCRFLLLSLEQLLLDCTLNG